MAADNDGDAGQQWWRTMMAADDEARKIGRQTMTGKDESGRQEMAETEEWR